MVKRQSITEEKIGELTRKIAAMPPLARNLSTRDAIQKLTVELRELIDVKGYSLEQVTDFLRGEGIGIKMSTLKSYLPSAKTSFTVSINNGEKIVETGKNDKIVKFKIKSNKRKNKKHLDKKENNSNDQPAPDFKISNDIDDI
jgi:hypothetical protein